MLTTNRWGRNHIGPNRDNVPLHTTIWWCAWWRSQSRSYQTKYQKNRSEKWWKKTASKENWNVSWKNSKTRLRYWGNIQIEKRTTACGRNKWLCRQMAISPQNHCVPSPPAGYRSPLQYQCIRFVWTWKWFYSAKSNVGIPSTRVCRRNRPPVCG